MKKEQIEKLIQVIRKNPKAFKESADFVKKLENNPELYNKWFLEKIVRPAYKKINNLHQR